MVTEEINSFCRKENLFGFEIPKKVKLIPNSLQTVNLLTPTFKLKRFEAKNYFENVIQDLYSK